MAGASAGHVCHFDPSTNRERMLLEMDDLIAQAVSIDERDPSAWAVRGSLALKWRWDAAFEANAQHCASIRPIYGS